MSPQFSGGARGGGRAPGPRVLLAAALVVLGAQVRPAAAYPFLAPRPIPDAIAGPTDPHPAAVFYNPAALAGLRGTHVYLDGAARLNLGRVDRAATEGVPSPGGADIRWADLDSFLGVTFTPRDLFTIALAIGTPWTDFTSYGDTALRYHAREHTLAVLEQSAAVGLRLADRFYVGAAFHVDEAWLRYSFARDVAPAGGSALVDQANQLCGGAPCGFENPLARQDLGLRGFGFGLGFGVGIVVKPVDRLHLALSYKSRIFSQSRGPDLALYDERQALVTPAVGLGVRCPSVVAPNTCAGNDQVSILLPDIVQFGLRFEATPRIDFEAGARYINYGARTALDVTIQGGNLDAVGTSPSTRVPAHFVLDRGLQDAWGLWMSGRFRVRDSLRLSPSLFFETSAVRSDVVNAASIDAPKLDVALTAEWRPVTHLVIGGHVGGTAYFLADAGQAFDPRKQATCVDAGYNLDACRDVSDGRGLPAAAGRYTLFVVHLGASVGLEF